MPNTIQTIVKAYLNGMTLKEFGDAFGVTHPTVINWRDGNTEPETDLLLRFRNISDWRGAFAKECLAAKGLL
jgi:hypothetical protein